ncbi:uncharacterized protein DDB_G0283357-like isoform X2 [Daktulosphaira vitifoliae]|uniref:uncharacterized protein DDB_G0283357-like isoform X2 n=1 Tax=Daktulosphaira vitifoliae TaxID=58002 RepID=UPI0021A97E2D|nr:uncharacterized protein DDB_G0283357-like isoform X2 [Daktulosphaira vitifoliae]
MSTLSGVSLKGEKSKGKIAFQSLKINSLYKGESTEVNQHKSIVTRKNGLQPLGKVIRNVRNPVNLPSEKSESNHESSINLVPIGGAGWGNKQTEKPLVVAGKEVPPTSTPTTLQSSQSGLVTGQQHVLSHTTSVTLTTTRPSHSDGKTWANKITDVPAAPTYLAHRTVQFQQEFPSLTSSGENKNQTNINTPSASTEQRPLLRPQTETSWMQGGSRPQMPQGINIISGSLNQAQSSSGSEIVNGVRSSSGQNGAGGVQVGLNPYIMQYSKNPVMRNMLPTFMVSNQSENMVQPQPKQNSYLSEKVTQHVSPSLSGNDNSLSKSTTDIKELVPPPIIRDEDLKRMNELSKEAGWSIHGEIDYNKKLDFSDDEDQYNEKLNKLSLNGDVKNKSDNSSFYGSSNKHPESNLNVKENIFGSMHINGIPYNSEYMNYYRPPSRQEERQIDDEFEEETVGRTTRAEELTTVLQRAKDRKLEEMKRFEESKLKKYDENHDNKEKELKDEMSKVRSDSSKVKNDDDKEINSKYSSSRLQKQFEHSSDVSNKIQTIPSTIRSLCRADSDMSSSGYSEYRSDSWIDDDHSNKSSSLKRDKRPEYDRFRKEKSRLDKDKSDRYAHNDYSRVDDNRKGYDHKRDFKRTENMNVSSKNEDMYDIDRNNKKESFSKVQKYHSRDSMETPEEIEKENLNVDDDSYSWSQKSLGKEYYKDDINSTGYNKMHIPGPITQEKFEACELTSEPKRNLTQLVKSERKDGKKNDQAEETNIKSKIGVWDLAPTNKSKIVHDQKFEHDSKSSKNNLKHEDETKTTEPKSSLENSSGLFFALSHHKGMRSDRNIGGSRSFHQNINSRTVSRSGSNRKSTWAESYDDNQRPRGPSRRDDRNRGEDRIRTDDRNRGDERNRNDDRNRGNNRQQNDRYSEKSALRGYGQRNDQRGRGRLSNTDSRTINGRNSQKNSDETNDKINKSNQNISSNRSKTSSKPQSKLDLYGDSSRRSNESRYNSKQSSRSFNSQKQEDIWESVSEPSDYENQQKNNSNRRQNSRTYLASSTRGEKRSSYDKKDPSKDSSNNEKLCQKSSLSTNDLKSFGDNRTNKKDESRKSSSEVLKNRVSNQNNRKDQSKSSSSRPNQSSNNTKAGQTNQRYERQKSQSQFVVDDSNTSIIKDAVIMVNNNPPPPPQTNAWDKPITHALRAQSPNVNKTVNQSNNRANSLTDIQENPSQNIQRLVLNKDKISPNVMENGIIDTTQRMETIIFENTTYKSKPCGESKNKYSSNIKREKESCNFNEEQDTCFRAFKTSNCDSKDAKINEAVQMSMTFKNDESSDLNLGFGDFESDFSRSGGHLSTENKDSVMSMTSHSRSMHTGPSSLAASDLKTMIAGTKKVWDDKPESNQQNSAESAFNTVYSTANTGQHDKSDMSVIDEQRVHNQQVYSPAPQLQNVSGSFIPVSMAAASGQLKQDPNSATTNVCKVKPQPQGTISPPLNQQQSSASTHAFSSSTTPQPHTSTTPLANTIPTQAAHMNLQIMMENNDGLPDIYSTHMMKQQQTHLILNTNNKAGVEMLAKQFVSAAPGPSPSSAMIFNSTQQHLIPPPSPSAPQVYQTMLEPTQTVINNATRSQFNQFTYGLQSNGLNQNSQFNPSMFIHTNTPGGQGGSEVFQSSISPFRLGPPYNNGQQINTNINPVLIPSSTNSSTSQVKPTSQQIGAIGNKTTYNASTPSSYMVQYDPNTMFNQPYNSMNSARATPLQSSSSLYSTNSATGPTNAGFIPNVASAFQAQVVAGASANSFGIPNAFGSPQNAAPNMQNYTSQYRQVPYLKGNLSSGSGNNDLQKSGVSNQQDIGNAMFSSNIFRQQFFDTNKPLMNSNQQTHQSMQGKYNNYQVSTSQNSQLPLMQQPRMNLNNSNNGSIAANIAPQYPSPIQRPVSTFPHLQRMPPPQNMRIQPNVPIQHFMNKSQSSNNYYVSNTGLIVEPQLPIASKIDNANSNVDSKAEEKIDNISKPKNTECKDDKQLVANE